jgi:hypothetical protein
MPEEDEKVQSTGQYDEPAYSGEDIPGKDEVNIPENIPQEHLTDVSPVTSSPVEKASKPLIFKRLVYGLLIIAVLVGAGFAAWKLVPSKGEKKQPAKAAQNQQQTAQNADPVALALGDTHLTQTFSSDALNLELKYPQGWTASEQNGAVTVKSPSFDLQDKNGSTSSTYFKLYIKKGADETDGKYLGKGYAVAPSEKLAYSDPAPGQRKSTYLTDFGLDTADNFAYFVVQGNFQLEKGDTLGPKFASEPDSFLLSGGFATDQQKDGLQTIELPIDSYKQNLAYKTGVQIIQSIQLK